MKNHLKKDYDLNSDTFIERGKFNYISFIDTLNIIKINHEGIITYTLKVNTAHDSIYSFSNLIIIAQNNNVTERIIHYNPTDEWMLAYNSGERINFNGEIIISDTNGNVIERKVGGNCMLAIYIACYGETCPCDGDGETYYVVVPCGGGGSGSGSGIDYPTDPIQGGYDPQDGGGGGGNNNTPSCQSLKSKLNEPLKENKNFKTRIQELKTKVFNSNDEWGYINQNPSEDPNIISNSTNQYNPARAKTLDDGRKAVIFDIKGPHIFGYMHTHPNDENTSGIHSAADILNFLKMVKFRYEMGYSTSDTYGIVIGNHGVYSLKIDNIDDFIAGFGSYSGNTLREFYEKFTREYKKIIENRTLDENNQSSNEKALLKFLELIKFDTGIGVYRATNDLQNWHKLQLNSNGQVQSNICN